MVAKIRSDGAAPRSAAGKIHQALPKLRNQLQFRGRYGAQLHRETKRRRSRETVERIRQTALLATITERIARKVTFDKRLETQRSGARGGDSDVVSPEPPIAVGKSFSEAVMVERTLRFS